MGRTHAVATKPGKPTEEVEFSPEEEAARDAEEAEVTGKAATYAEKIGALARRFRQERDRGVVVELDGAAVTIATTHAAQQELAATADRLAGGGTHKAVTRSGHPVVFDHAKAAAAKQAIDDHHAAMHAVEHDHAVALKALLDDDAKTAADIRAYDISSGWT